ncbi:hypothetical protein [Streptomyces atratus]|uniref:hypothetical protein n=1 Tax=Streptomyces atratus TaxID=1893 RepID=UPI00224D90EC|nr:hypothetical protein [Streptomyces atratus]MCX5338537.1 hypothetical protein [Streptomyces atratus]
MSNRPITGGVGLPPYAALADAVRLLAGTENMGRTEAAAADGRLREELAAALARTDPGFRLKLRVAPVRQGPAGVLAYLLHEADRLSGLVRSMPRTPGLSREHEAARVSLTFLRHTAQEVSRISRRSTPTPHAGARLTIFDQLPYQSLHGLVPVALSMSHMKTTKAQWERLRRAEESGLLTVAEEEITGPAEHAYDMESFVRRTQNRQRWAAPLWAGPEHPAVASAEPKVLSASAERELVDELEAEAARAAGLDVAHLAALCSRFAAQDPSVTSEECRRLRFAATALERRAAATARSRPESRAAHLVDVYVTRAREETRSLTTRIAVNVLNACSAARESLHLREAGRAAAREVQAALPGGKPQPMCEVDYLQHVREQVGQALDGIAHSLRSKRMVLLIPPVADATAETALQRLNVTFGGTCVLLGGIDDAAIRIPPPSQFGIRRRRARSCECGRHTAGRDGEEER